VIVCFAYYRYKILAKVGVLANILIFLDIFSKPAILRRLLILHYATVPATIFIILIIPISYEILHCRVPTIAKRNKRRPQPPSAREYLRKSLN
jgi:hypothetical protein